MATKELKHVRALRRQLVALNFQELEAAIQRRRGETDNDSVFGDIAESRREITELLNAAETRYLVCIAEKWGIEVPYKREWYSFEIKNPDPGIVPGETVTIYKNSLNSLGLSVINKQIRDARFAYWKGWIDLLIPILALIVAALALFKEIIVEALKQ
jgi:hypothetical protein